MIEARNDMITKPRREKTGSGKASRSWRRKHTNLAKAEANPTAGLDCIVVKSRSSRAHAKKPRIGVPAKRKGRKIVAASEISRKSDEQNETRQLEMTRKKVDKE
jgi:hypothetical protein